MQTTMIGAESGAPFKGHIHLMEWDSPAACMADEPPSHLAYKALEVVSSSCDTACDDPMQWLGVDRLATMHRVIREGWQEGAERIMRLADLNMPEPVRLKRRKARADFGDEYDMHAALAGQHDRAWITTRRQPRNGVRRITLVCEISAHRGEKADDLAWRGVAALKLADALESAGYQVRIIGTSAAEEISRVSGEPEAAVHNVVAKDYDQPTDLANLAAVVALAGFKRYYLHRWQFSRRNPAKTSSGLGSKSYPLLAWNFKRIAADCDAIRIPDGVTSLERCAALLAEVSERIAGAE